jgi:hypothetical protein
MAWIVMNQMGRLDESPPSLKACTLASVQVNDSGTKRA